MVHRLVNGEWKEDKDLKGKKRYILILSSFPQILIYNSLPPRSIIKHQPVQRTWEIYKSA